MEDEQKKKLEEEKASEQLSSRCAELAQIAEEQFYQYIKDEQDSMETAQIGAFIIANRKPSQNKSPQSDIGNQAKELIQRIPYPSMKR